MLLKFENNSALNVFTTYYSMYFTLVPDPNNKYIINYVVLYFRHFLQSDTFCLTFTVEIHIDKK